MKRILVSFIVILLLHQAGAQDLTDALRYSYMTGQGGTARNQALGGAGVSLGGEFSSLFLNPAGLGHFKTGDIILTPFYRFNSNEGRYFANTATAQSSKLGLGTSGILLSDPRNRGKIKSLTVGIGFNRLADFNNAVNYSGTNKFTSYSEKFLEELINNHVMDPNSAAQDYPFGTSMAFNTFLIDTLLDNEGNLIGYQSLANPAFGLDQAMSVETSGGITEASVGVGINISEKLFLGGSIGVPILHYRRDAKYKETDEGNRISNFNYFTAQETLETKGTGINAKLGIIYQPMDKLRFGLAFHTPTFFQFTDDYNMTITTDLEGYAGPGELKQSSRDLNDGYMLRSKYNFSNPMRAMLGATYFFGIGPDMSQQKGFVTADVEYVNYGQAGFHDAQNSQAYKDYFKELKELIKDEYGSNVNLRLGSEFKFNTWMVRIGGAYYGNPYSYEDAHTLRLSGGFGYRNKGFFIDVSYSHAIQKDVTYPYILQDMPNHAALLNNMGQYIGVTFGFKYF
ncbi:MAG: hypothetical protein J5I50_12605 [Chitinophagaceae bacterium]|nr:hypothetical protein [Chitinophagaceae bacterium]